MAQRIFLVLVVLSFPFSGEIFAQQKVVENFFNKTVHSAIKPGIWSTATRQLNAVLSSECKQASVSFFPATLQPVAASWYADQFSFICRQEWQFQKNTGIPLRVRLGSLEYVDRLEGKRKEIGLINR